MVPWLQFEIVTEFINFYNNVMYSDQNTFERTTTASKIVPVLSSFDTICLNGNRTYIKNDNNDNNDNNDTYMMSMFKHVMYDPSINTQTTQPEFERNIRVGGQNIHPIM